MQMDTLPLEIQALIISNADVPVDTFLYFSKTVGARPKKINVDAATRNELEKLYSKRAANWARKKQLENESLSAHGPLDWFTKDFDRERSIEIMVGEDWTTKEIKFSFRARKTTYDDPEWPEMWTMRKTIVDMQTGQATTDWCGDSDDDDDDEW